jgi:DNA-binding MarR family transcriptional regulator
MPKNPQPGRGSARRPNAPGRAGTPRTRHTQDAAEALVTVAPLVSRWIERLLAAHDPPLTVAHFLALQAIANEDISGTELARRTGVSGPAVSQLLAVLVDAGLLQRDAFAGDRRRQTLCLSPVGRRALGSAQKLLRARLSALLEELPAPEADALARALPQVAATLSGAPPPRRPHPPRPPQRPPPRPRR